MSYVFQKGETYRIGNLHADSIGDPSNPYPKFLNSPPPMSISAEELLKIVIKDFSMYLRKNPHNFNAKRTIFIYKSDENGNKKLIDEGNPFPKVDTQRRGQRNSGLSDNRNDSRNYNQSDGVNTQLCDIYQDQVRRLEDEIRQKNARIEDITQKIISKDDIIATMKADLRVAEIENDKLQGALEGYVGKYGGQNGLSDGAGSNLMDKGLGILDKIASNPAGQEAIGRLMGKLAGFLGAPEQVQPPVVPENNEMQNLGFKPVNGSVRSSIENI